MPRIIAPLGVFIHSIEKLSFIAQNKKTNSISGFPE
jgi:hypothetical protein